MGMASGTFSAAQSGPLQIFFSAEMGATSFDWGSGARSDIILLCSVTDGTTTRTAYISPASSSVAVDWDYVTGTTLTCSMSVSYENINGAGVVYAIKQRIRGILMKR